MSLCMRLQSLSLVKAEMPNHDEALIRHEVRRIRASQESPVKEQCTGRQKRKGNKLPCR
jgi:hypothetical protein